jgi:biopolymer transport protein ExbB
MESVKDFPVLVRLRAADIDFTTARDDGGDIRFAKDDGTRLPFEIERWDSAANEAEVWVNIDTIRGNDSTQFITLYWGNTEAAGESNGRAVFDTGAGFAGVWHLGESGEILQDATINGFNGSRSGDQVQREGVIGYGQYLDGTGDFTEMGDVCDPGEANFSVCLWVKRARTDVRSTIISKSTGGSASPSYGWLVELDPDGAMIVFMASESST